MSRRHTSIHSAIARNTHPCEVAGCDKPRRGLSIHCAVHRTQARNTGHAEGKLRRNHEYGYERQQVEAHLERHRDHPGIIAGEAWCDQLLRDAIWNREQPGQADLLRLHDAGVQGRHILRICAAVWLKSHWEPRSLPDDVRLDYALSQAVIHLVPLAHRGFTPAGNVKRSRPKESDRRDLGALLRRVLGGLCGNICYSLDAFENKRREGISSLTMPFNPDETYDAEGTS